MTTWLEDASANRHIKTYVKDFLDVSGNMTVRQYNEDYKWNSYGQLMSGPYESDGSVFFGISVGMDVSGLTMVVGANKQNGNNISDGGAVHVYRYDTTAEIWYQLGNLITGESNNNEFGYNVDINDAGTRIMATDPGADFVNVYDYNSGTNTWDKQVNLTTSDGIVAVDYYAGRISGDGNTIVFGAYTNNSKTGKQYVYRNTSGTTWTKIGEFTGSHTSAYGGVGTSISYDGNRITFTELEYNYDANGNTVSDLGRVTIYDYSGSGTSWNQVGNPIYQGSTGDKMDCADLSKDGSVVAIGTKQADYVKVCQYDNGSWKQLGSTIRPPASGVQFGTGVRLSDDGTTLLICDQHDSTAGTKNGALFIYKYIGYDWVQQGSTLYGAYLGAQLGYLHSGAIAMSGDGTKIVAGGLVADVNGTDSGYVQSFQWSQKSYEKPIMDISGGTLTISNGEEHKARGYVVTKLGDTLTGSNDSFGYTVNMNYTGDMMIVGRNTATSANAYPTVYKYRNGYWSQVGTNVYGENSTYFSMISLINNDGTVIAASSHTSVDGGSEGAIHVYEFINGDWSLKGSAIQGSGSGAYFSIDGMELSGDGTVVAGVSRTNYAKVFKYVEDSTNDWVQMGSDFTINPSSSMLAVTISSRVIGLSDDGTVFAASSTGDDTTGTDNGKVEVYKFTGDVDTGSWNQLGSTIYGVDHAASSTYEGMTLKLSADGTILATGSWKYNSSYGYIRVFKYIEAVGDWCQMGADIQPNRSGSWARGFDMSSDGKTLALGEANADDGQVRNDEGGTNIIKYINGQWVYIDHIASTYAVVDTYLGKYVTISGDGKRFAAGSNTNPGIVEAWEITNPPFIKIDKDGVSLDNLFTGDNVTLQCPTLKGVSGATANYESFWGRNPGLGDWNSSYGNQNAGYLYIDNAYNSAFDLLLTGSYTEYGGGGQRRGHELASRSGGSLSFQTRIESANTNEAFSLGVNAIAYNFRLTISGAAWSSGSYYSSDDRIKHNETPLTNALETIRKLNPQHYIKTIAMYDADHQLELDASGNPLDASGNPMPVSEYTREDGFIAQEVNEIPELKYTFVESVADDQPHGLDYTSIFTTAVKALKELDELDGERQTTLSSLQARIDALETK